MEISNLPDKEFKAMIIKMPNELRRMDDHSERPHTYMVNSSMTKEARIYNGEKTTSSIKGVGKTRQLHVKE